MPLPTKTDAVFVRPTSIQVPEGKTERRELRTTHSKTILHAEKSHDGKEIRTCEVRMGAVCYVSDDGSLRSIDTTIRDLGGRIGVEWAPYRFNLHDTGIGFDFESREGGSVSVTLLGIGGERFDQDTPLKPDITGNTITFRDVRPGCDIVFKCLNQRVKTLRILRDENAPREFVWQVDSDKPELIDSTLFGDDAAGNQLELSETVNGNTITETWTGKVKVRLDPTTRIRSLSDAVSYPVEIDPTVTARPTANEDDGTERRTIGIYTQTRTKDYFGHFSLYYDPFFRCTLVNVPQGSTVTSATLTLNCVKVTGTGAGGTLYAEDVANASQFTNTPDHKPSGMAKTTASTTVATISTTGVKNIDVTAVVQEIFDRGDWSANNALNLVIFSTTGGSNITYFEDYNAAGTDHASLSVTYTEAAGGTAGNLLLNQAITRASRW